MKPLILVGGGGHCKSVIDVAEQCGYKIHGILDLPENVGKSVLNYTVIGTDDSISEFVGDYYFVITAGQIKDSKLRRKLFDKVTEVGGMLPSIISPHATVSKYSKIGKGTVVLHNAVINADTIIGDGCIINTLSNVEHDSIVGDFCHISTGAMINGGCKIGSGCFIGSQSVLSHCTNLVEDVVISAGSFVHKSVYVKGIYFGNPAKLIKRL